MVACWRYKPENRVNFQDIHARLKDMLSDGEREQPAVWFANEATSETVRSIAVERVAAQHVSSLGAQCAQLRPEPYRAADVAVIRRVRHGRVPLVDVRLLLVDDREQLAHATSLDSSRFAVPTASYRRYDQ